MFLRVEGTNLNIYLVRSDNLTLSKLNILVSIIVIAFHIS